MSKILNLSEAQEEAYKTWAKTHTCPCRDKDGNRYVSAFGGADTFHLTNTSIGWIVEAYCVCGAKIDLTEDF